MDGRERRMNVEEVEADEDDADQQEEGVEEDEDRAASVPDRMCSPPQVPSTGHPPASDDIASGDIVRRHVAEDDDDNVFHNLLRMAMAAILAFLVASQGLFLSAAAQSMESVGTERRTSKAAEGKSADDKKEGRKKRKNSSSPPSSSSPPAASSSAQSSDRDDHSDEEAKKKVPLKIDTEKLLHTDTMPKETSVIVPESPPIEIETVGVQRDKICADLEAKTAKVREESVQAGLKTASTGEMPFIIPGGEEQEEEDEDFEEDFQRMAAHFGRLDAILEEDSDELRSALSSRASTARQQYHRPPLSPQTEEHPKEHFEQLHPAGHPQHTFEQLHPAGHHQHTFEQLHPAGHPQHTFEQLHPAGHHQHTFEQLHPAGHPQHTFEQLHPAGHPQHTFEQLHPAGHHQHTFEQLHPAGHHQHTFEQLHPAGHPQHTFEQLHPAGHPQHTFEQLHPAGHHQQTPHPQHFAHPPAAFAQPFQFVFRRQQSAGAFSQSLGAKVDELSTPEEESVGGEESGREPEETLPPNVPPLKLEELSPEGKSPSDSQSDADTVLIIEEEEAEEQTQIPDQMFHPPPTDADRDQSELVEAMTDQQITSRGTPPNEDGVRSPSMSINLDRSRESEHLDHSICSDPQFDESLMAASLIAAHKRAMGEDEEETPRAGEVQAEERRRAQSPTGERKTTTTTPPRGWQRHERISTTSSSVDGVEIDDEKDELPPPPPSMLQQTFRNGVIPRKVQEEKIPHHPPIYPPNVHLHPPHHPPTVHLHPPHHPPTVHLHPPHHPAIGHLHPHHPPPPPPPPLPVSKPLVTPLWGRNERLVGYLHGYGALLGKTGAVRADEKENIIVGPRGDAKLEEQHRRADEWTVHPIMLKEDRARLEERVIPIQRRTAETTAWRGSPLLSSPRRISKEWTTQAVRQAEDLPMHDGSRRNAPMATDHLAPLPPSFYSSTIPSKPNSSFDKYSRDSSSPRHEPSQKDAPFLMSSSTANFPRPPGIRDIPIQRSASAFAPMFGSVAGGATAPLHSSRPPTTAPSEYYRREVLTRTLVTRSSETLSAAPPLGRSSPAAPLLTLEQPPPPRDEMQEEYWLRYSRNIEEEERRVREAQDRRKRDEEDRRKRVEEQRRRWEQQELEQLERLRRERERMEQALEAQTLDRERVERERIGHDRAEREAAEKRRREEWERIERERRQYEEAELEKRRNLERLERERLERERSEAERLERERLEALRREQERLEQQRLEQERLELERLEFERLEIERIERIKRDQREKEERDRERAKQEAERLAREREELERLERERIELERQAKELMEKERREEEERERERREEALREALRREEELREREVLERAEREAQEREMARRARERAEQERLEALRREQERLEQEQLEAERRERERQEEERRERELLEASLRAKERRDFERLEEEERERQRQEEERRERERRDRERLEAVERERQRQSEEQRERDRLAALEASAVERRALRAREGQRARERAELDRRAEELRDLERRERERRDRERAEEERRLAELRDAELRNAGQREMERREAQEREERRRQDGWRSRERLEQLARERDERERWEAEKRRLLSDYEQEARKRQGLTSKETLERLTRKPYYSRENLTQLSTGEPTELRGRGAEPSEITTKVERQVIERVDRTLWTEPETLRASVGLPPPPVTSAYFGNTCGILPSLLDASEESVRERIYNPRDEDFLRRGGSQRTSKYRARMEKARKEFLQGTPGTEHLPPSADPVSERFRKSTEELQQRRVEYRGPLLQRFNSGEFAHAPLEPPPTHYAPGFGRSPYEQEEHRRSRSVLDYSPRQSRRDMPDQEAEAQHSRSKSADYLTDPRRPRDEQHIPENDLQKSVIGCGLSPPSATAMGAPVGEHELRFRKSTERMQVPDWYRDYHQAPPPQHQLTMPSPMTTATSGVFSAGGTSAAGMASRPTDFLHSSTQQPWSYLPPSSMTPSSPPVGGIAFPAGMFDKYKNEIEDMRRSRTSLHQLGQPQQQQQQAHTKTPSEPSLLTETRTVTREYSREAYSKTSTVPYPDGRQQPGYTVSTVPTEWGTVRDRKHSRVVEVADTFIDRQLPGAAPLAHRYGGRITLEEALDAIFQSTQPVEEPPPADPGMPEQQLHLRNMDGPGIFTPDQALMDRLAEQPHLAESLLKNEPMFVRCAFCAYVRPLRDARFHFCWCRHCYTYYCSRQCRLRDWHRHRDRCSFARINSLCKEVIMKVRRDPETQYHMSRVAREGFRREGRGSVNIRLISAYSAQLYLEQGWRVFAQHDPNQLLFYYPIQALVEQRKEPSLIQLCKKYNPNEKFILSVSIIADIEQCPQTPPPAEPTSGIVGSATSNNAFPTVYGTAAVPTNV
uniref:Apical junction molecule ajm1 alpha/beta domain-containing protein n=1 Tax=Globodera rostochiensis TaxID=31243 RepID=A0A914GYJ9_GLORO